MLFFYTFYIVVYKDFVSAVCACNRKNVDVYSMIMCKKKLNLVITRPLCQFTTPTDVHFTFDLSFKVVKK